MAVNRKRKAKANRVDSHVGRRLRQRRIVMGVGVKKLAKVIDVGYRQIQKYELGIDRIAASDLYRFARFFGVPVSYFFAGLPGGRAAAAQADGESATGSINVTKRWNSWGPITASLARSGGARSMNSSGR